MPAVAALNRDAFAEARECFGKIETFLVSKEACSLRESDLERELEKRGRELMRQMIEAHLDGKERAGHPVPRFPIATLFHHSPEHVVVDSHVLRSSRPACAVLDVAVDKKPREHHLWFPRAP